MTQNYRLCLVGFGHVGQAFARLLLKKQSELADRYGLSVSVTGIITGTPSTAVLRVSDEHYVVREGDWLDNNVRVHAISESAVTLRDRGKTYMLRLGR